jgi:hypothetical protein
MDETIRHEIDRARAGRTSRHWLRGPEICRAADITYRQLDYWARTGVLEPVIAPARGSGTQRRYSAHQGHVAGVLGLLSAMGAQRTAMAAVTATLGTMSIDEWDGLLLVWPDGETHLVAPADLADLAFRGAWVVNLEACRAEAERRNPRMATAS